MLELLLARFFDPLGLPRGFLMAGNLDSSEDDL